MPSELSTVISFLHRLPYCLRVLFESAVRNADFSTDKEVADVWSAVARNLLADNCLDDNDDSDDDNPEVLFQPGEISPGTVFTKPT